MSTSRLTGSSMILVLRTEIRNINQALAENVLWKYSMFNWFSETLGYQNEQEREKK